MWLNFVFVIKTFYVFNYKGKDTNFPEICPVFVRFLLKISTTNYY